jgi:hypothetical protein
MERSVKADSAVWQGPLAVQLLDVGGQPAPDGLHLVEALRLARRPQRLAALQAGKDGEENSRGQGGGEERGQGAGHGGGLLRQCATGRPT